MRRQLPLPTPRLLASVLASVLAVPLLAACGGSGTGTTGTATSGASAPASGVPGALPAVTGDFGHKPTLAAPAGTPPKELQVQVLNHGDGPTVTKGDLLVADYLGETWSAAKPFDSSYDRGRPIGLPIGVGRVFKGFDSGLVGKKVGDRVLLSIPPSEGFGPQGNPQAGIKPDDSLLFVIDIRGAYGADAAAQGQTIGTHQAALPTVSGGTGKPKVTIPARKPPSSLMVQTLVMGKGPLVQKGQLLVAQYEGLTWRGSKQFDSSWDRGQPASFPIGVGGVIPGWDKALVGKRIGSRVLMVLPPADGYGKAGNSQAGIKPKDTLVFVVDLVAAYGEPS